MASEAPGDTWPAPYYVMTREAARLVAAARKYWNPEVDASGAVAVPGLASARLNATIIDEIAELVDAVQQAQSVQLMTLPPIWSYTWWSYRSSREQWSGGTSQSSWRGVPFCRRRATRSWSGWR